MSSRSVISSNGIAKCFAKKKKIMWKIELDYNENTLRAFVLILYIKTNEFKCLHHSTSFSDQVKLGT